MLLISLSIGGTIYLTKTGQDSACKVGWVLVTEGEREGQYVCTSSTPDRYQWCYALRDTATKGYWCEIGIINQTDPEDMKTPIIIDDVIVEVQPIISSLKQDKVLNVNTITKSCDAERCVYTTDYNGVLIDYSMSVAEANQGEKNTQRLLDYFDSYYRANYGNKTIAHIDWVKIEEPITKINNDKLLIK